MFAYGDAPAARGGHDGATASPGCGAVQEHYPGNAAAGLGGRTAGRDLDVDVMGFAVNDVMGFAMVPSAA